MEDGREKDHIRVGVQRQKLGHGEVVLEQDLGRGAVSMVALLILAPLSPTRRWSVAPCASCACRPRAPPDRAQLLEWKLMSCSHGQELGQFADLASDWLFNLEHQIRSQFAC